VSPYVLIFNDRSTLTCYCCITAGYVFNSNCRVSLRLTGGLELVLESLETEKADISAVVSSSHYEGRVFAFFDALEPKTRRVWWNVCPW
jgi:hypothetical protein